VPDAARVDDGPGRLAGRVAEASSVPPHDSSAAADAALADSHHLARGAAASTVVLLAANFRAVFTLLIARLLGEAALGRFGLAFATAELLSKAGMVGLDNAVIPLLAPRLVRGDRAGALSVYRRALSLAATVSTGLALVAIPVTVWIAARQGVDAFARGEAIILLALPGIALARVSTSASRAVLAMRSEFYSRGLTETWTTIAVLVIAIALGVRDRAPALAVALGTLAGGVVAVALANRALRERPFRLSPPSAEPSPPVALKRPRESGDDSVAGMLRLSLPIAGSSLLTVLVTQADVLLLGVFVNRAPGVTAESFGVYCAAAAAAGGLRKVRQIFDPILAPIMAARSVSTDRERLREIVAAPSRWVLATQIPMVAVGMLAGGTVLGVYGAGFRGGATWLAILVLAHGANTFAGLVETLLMIERPVLNLMNAGVTVVVQVTIGLLLIPRFGVTGAAAATLTAFLAQGVLRFVEVRHVMGWHWPWASLTRPFMAGLLAAIPAGTWRALAGSRVEVPAALLFLALYVAMWLVFGADPADRVLWRRLLKRE
jgi:O-antigen/teichoic acid export membrane protein